MPPATRLRSSASKPTRPEFFETALSEGVRVIIGLDAHEPEELADSTQWDIAVRELKAFGERHIDRIDSGK